MSEEDAIVKKIKWVVLGLLVVLGLFVAVVLVSPLGLADIRPDGLKSSPQAKLWYERAVKAHGGRKRWRKIGQARVDMTALFSSFMIRKALGPFGRAKTPLSWRYVPSQRWPVRIEEKRAGRSPALYVRGAKGTYRLIDGKKLENPWRFKFFVRSIRHLLDFVFAMKSADVVLYAGKATWRGQSYHRVFMTWKTAKPNHDIDQYILWINDKTHLMDRFDCTGRRVMPFVPTPFIVARVEFKGYKRRQGMAVPSSMMVYRASSVNDLVHGYLIHKASFTMSPKSF